MSMTKKIVVSAYWMCILPNLQNSQAGMNILEENGPTSQAYNLYVDLAKLKMVMSAEWICKLFAHKIN